MRRYAALWGMGAFLIAGTPGAGGDGGPTPEYRLPWEVQADKERKAAETEAVEAEPIEVEADAMTVVRLIRAGKKIISSHPEVADVYLENPDMLFVFGRTPGSTRLVVADSASQVVWEGTVVVHPPEKEKAASSPAEAVPAGTSPGR